MDDYGRAVLPGSLHVNPFGQLVNQRMLDGVQTLPCVRIGMLTEYTFSEPGAIQLAVCTNGLRAEHVNDAL